MTDVFKSQVVSYCDLDDRVKSLNKELKDIRQKQKEISENIMEYMTSNSLEVCNAGNYGVITLRTSVSKSGINKENVKESLSHIFNDTNMMSKSHEMLAEEASEYIMNNRETTERHVLKRSGVKKK